MTFFRRNQQNDARDASPEEMYDELRDQVLRLEAAQLGSDAERAPLLALLMETGYPEGVATLVGVADGSTSLYFSNGGGVIGAGEHAAVARATRGWLDMGGGMLELLAASDDEPRPPGEGLTQFVAVTPNGLRAPSRPRRTWARSATGYRRSFTRATTSSRKSTSKATDRTVRRPRRFRGSAVEIFSHGRAQAACQTAPPRGGGRPGQYVVVAERPV